LATRPSFRGFFRSVLLAEVIAFLLMVWACRVLLLAQQPGWSTSADLWTVDGKSWWIGDAKSRAGFGPEIELSPTAAATQSYRFTLGHVGRYAELRWGEHRWRIGEVYGKRLVWEDKRPPQVDIPGILSSARRFDISAGDGPDDGLTAAILASPSSNGPITIVHRTLDWSHIGVVIGIAALVGVLGHGLVFVCFHSVFKNRYIERMRKQSRCEQCAYPLGGLPAGSTCPECGKLAAQGSREGGLSDRTI
jgi:hypothetical protein